MIEMDNFMAEPCDSIQNALEFYRMHEASGKFLSFMRLAQFFFSLPVVSVVSSRELVDYCNQMERQTNSSATHAQSPHTLESLVFVKNNLNFY